MRPSRSSLFSSVAASLASAAGLLMLTMMPSPAQADITCTQYGTDTFHVGSTIKFQWNDTQTVQIDTFNLDLYCVQTGLLIQTLTTLNQTSPATVSWVVNSTLSAFTTQCSLNQYQGSFDWTYADSNTGATVAGQAKCKVMLLIDGTSTATGSSPSDPAGTDDTQSSDIIVSDKTKSIVIGVGCAVGVLVLAGFVGFYYIRYSNRREVEKQMSKKLREPVQSGPLFPPVDRSSGGGLGANARHSRYNELASITTTSVSAGSPATTAAKTEMVELGATAYHATSPALGSRSPTPIAAAHAKLNGGGAVTPVPSMLGRDRPGSLLTSPFVPMDDSSRSPSPHNPFEQRENVQHQRQYEQELQLQQQQQQQQQQQEQQNYGSYPY